MCFSLNPHTHKQYVCFYSSHWEIEIHRIPNIQIQPSNDIYNLYIKCGNQINLQIKRNPYDWNPNERYLYECQQILFFTFENWLNGYDAINNVIINHWLLLNVIRWTLFNSTEISLHRWWMNVRRPTSISIYCTDSRNTAICYVLCIPFNVLGYDILFACRVFSSSRAWFFFLSLFFLHFHRTTDWCTKNGLRKFVSFSKVLSRQWKPMLKTRLHALLRFGKYYTWMLIG